MEKNPDARYATAKEMALDLQRYLSGRAVMARPTLYQSTLAQRVSPHREQIREWQELKLIYPHEAGTLQRAYDRLESREEDWIVQSRVLSFSQISLYLGAFLLVCGSLLYTGAYFSNEATGLVKPLLVLGLPLVGLNILGILLFNRGRQAVAIAFFLAAAIILPQILLVIFKETGWWGAPAGAEWQLFEDSALSNRRLQISGFLACIWACWLSFRTKTTALATVFIVLATAFHIAILADFELRKWLEEGMWNTLAFYLLPLLLFFAVLGVLTDRKKQPWFALPSYIAACGLFVIIIELLALKGKLFEHLHITLAWVHPQLGEDEITLLNTLAAMTLNGLLIYITGWLLDRHGTSVLKRPAQLLFIISPFAILEPVATINGQQKYAEFYNWFYLFMAITIAYLSRFRQRKSFYFAGLINCGIGLYMITERKEWFDNFTWAVAVVIVSLAVLAAGYGLNARERRYRRSA